MDRKRVLVIGLKLFAVGAVLAALSPGYFSLMAARVLWSVRW